MAQFRISYPDYVNITGTEAGDYVTFANDPGASGDWTVSIDTGDGNDRIDLDPSALPSGRWGNNFGDPGDILTGAGDDRVAINGLCTRLDTGTGNDRVVLAGATYDARINLDAGDDRLTIREAWASIVMRDSEGNRIEVEPATAAFSNYIYLGDGNDWAQLSLGADNVVDGGDGNDTIMLRLSTEELYPGYDPILSSAAGRSLVKGGAGHDVIDGRGGAVREIDIRAKIHGEDGNDLIFGGRAHDTLDGGDGADTLDGFLGDDLIFGGDDTDTLRGGDGNDTLVGGEGIGTSPENGWNGHAFRLTNDDASNDLLFGGRGDDLILGGAGKDHLRGGSDNDTLDGGDGHDKLMGGQGDDLVMGGAGRDFLNGHAGNDTLEGGADRDVLMDSAGDNSLDGGAGNDILRVGGGNSTLTGGEGGDIMSFRMGDGLTGNHRITDFDTSEDKLDLSRLPDDEVLEVLFGQGDGNDLAIRSDDGEILIEDQNEDDDFWAGFF